MIYNNLVYLLVVVLILATSSVPDVPQVTFLHAVTIFLLKGFLFLYLVKRSHSRRRVTNASQYFRSEQRAAILAIVTFALDVYLLDSQYYFAQLPMISSLPALVDFCGLLLFFGYFSIIWLAGRINYALVFGRLYSHREFLFSNIKLNLPIVLPWLLLSLLADLLQRVPIPFVQDILTSVWGEPLLFLLFFLFLAVVFPVLITRLWNCTSMPNGPFRDHIEKFCAKLGLEYSDILIWPLFEGKMLTAGVMGLTRKFRYLLVTPSLLEALSLEEVEAVMAHEIGHVKRFHLQLYLVLFLGFGLVAHSITFPIFTYLLNSNLFYTVADFSHKEPGTVLAFLITIPMFLLMVLYFRFILGFFMRNFERQADLFAWKVMGGSSALNRVFEKIAWLSGSIRDLPNWHHFGIGQRIEYLEQCDRDSRCIKRHHQKVYGALVLYVLVLGISSILFWQSPGEELDGVNREKFVAAALQQNIEKDPDNPLWYQLMGDLQQSRYLYRESVAYYEQSLRLVPANPEVLNNLAWMLLTARDPEVLDPVRALELAEQAVALIGHAHILDTLATACWANGQVDRAVSYERQAIAVDPANHDFYRGQIEKFQSGPWNQEGD